MAITKPVNLKLRDTIHKLKAEGVASKDIVKTLKKMNIKKSDGTPVTEGSVTYYLYSKDSKRFADNARAK